MQDLLFRVIDKGHEYKIYSNGEIEGFGDGALVFNYFPQLAAGPRVPRNAQPAESCHPKVVVAHTELR